MAEHCSQCGLLVDKSSATHSPEVELCRQGNQHASNDLGLCCNCARFMKVWDDPKWHRKVAHSTDDVTPSLHGEKKAVDISPDKEVCACDDSTMRLLAGLPTLQETLGDGTRWASPEQRPAAGGPS